MAYATAIAIGITCLMAMPALAGDDVYVYRDPSGVVRFSASRDEQADRRQAEQASAARERERQQLAANDLQK